MSWIHLVTSFYAKTASPDPEVIVDIEALRDLIALLEAQIAERESEIIPIEESYSEPVKEAIREANNRLFANSIVPLQYFLLEKQALLDELEDIYG